MPRMTREGHCSFDECIKPIKAKRLCSGHYYKYLYPRFIDRPNVVTKKKIAEEREILENMFGRLA